MKNIFYSILFYLHIVSSIDITQLYGDWVQVYSNNYIQTTSEIDWYCVTINVSPYKTSMFKIQKYTNIHDIEPFSTYISFYNNYSYSSHDNKYNFSPSTIFHYKYQLINTDDLRNNTFDYLIWTLNDDISYYVWARNFTDFNLKYDKNVLNILKQYNYQGYYKNPLKSYTIECENKIP
jgi:hypothetical protein